MLVGHHGLHVTLCNLQSAISHKFAYYYKILHAAGSFDGSNQLPEG